MLVVPLAALAPLAPVVLAVLVIALLGKADVAAGDAAGAVAAAGGAALADEAAPALAVDDASVAEGVAEAAIGAADWEFQRTPIRPAATLGRPRSTTRLSDVGGSRAHISCNSTQ